MAKPFPPWSAAAMPPFLFVFPIALRQNAMDWPAYLWVGVQEIRRKGPTQQLQHRMWLGGHAGVARVAKAHEKGFQLLASRSKLKAFHAALLSQQGGMHQKRVPRRDGDDMRPDGKGACGGNGVGCADRQGSIFSGCRRWRDWRAAAADRSPDRASKYAVCSIKG
jgi:hypothetical protein